MRLGEGFYLPSLQIAGAPGAPLIVEVTLGDARDRALLHGRVGRVDEGGLWLDGIRTGLRWTPLPGSPCRRHRRIGCSIFAEVRPRHAAAWLCRTLDLSLGGIRLVTGSFEMGVAGDDLQLTLIAPDLQVEPVEIRTRLAWTAARQAGLTVLEAPMGLKKMIAAAGAQWKAAPVIRHPKSCTCTRKVRRAG